MSRRTSWRVQPRHRPGGIAARSLIIQTWTVFPSPARRRRRTRCAGAIKRQARAQPEMGGKSPLVVLDHADLEPAVTCAIDAFFGTGQRCTASSRIIVTEGIDDLFVEALAERARSLRVGDALDPNTQIGPAVNEGQLEQNLRYVDIAKNEGGKVLTGGGPLELDKRGYYMAPPSLLTPRPTSASIARRSSGRSQAPCASRIMTRHWRSRTAGSSDFPRESSPIH